MANSVDFVIRWSFILLFFLVPLVFFSGSFELFEYNKMMVTYALTIIIAGAWATKMIVNGKFNFRRTPLDIPIVLYLASHILSTVFSIDVHTSIWGYYSRFHEGLFATFSYIILFYAAVSNLKKEDIVKILYSSFTAGVIVSLWGTMEHFGNSPSCYFITGKGGVDCWIQDVKNRVFATLGQPNWMAAYLNILILVSLGFILSLKKIRPYLYFLPPLFFAGLLFTKSRSGILGLFAGLAVFAILYAGINSHSLKDNLLSKTALIIATSFLILVAIFGLPLSQTEKFSIEGFLATKKAESVQKPASPDGYIDIGISESGDIRKIVWDGAIKIWKRYPIFGSGVETFAYSYYKDRPVAHNMVSEWDFLYNKAHNEFLNILATTGLVGMLAYLAFIGTFVWWFLKNWKHQNTLSLSLFAGWITILVTNFFGFSVVIIGLFFFLIPAFIFVFKEDNNIQLTPKQQSIGRLGAVSAIIFVSLFLLYRLAVMWQADKSFAYGKNLDGIGEYQQAFSFLVDAVNKNPGEPTFRDELAYNESVLALAFHKQSTTSAEAIQLTKESIANSNQVLTISPNVLTFWKTRTRIFYNLAAIDKRFLFNAVDAIKNASNLAPTDAKVNYNYGYLLGQTGDVKQGIKVLEKVVTMKPDYADARFALGTYYAQIGQKDKARAQMEFMLKRIGLDDRAKKWLEENK